MNYTGTKLIKIYERMVVALMEKEGISLYEAAEVIKKFIKQFEEEMKRRKTFN